MARGSSCSRRLDAPLVAARPRGRAARRRRPLRRRVPAQARLPRASSVERVFAGRMRAERRTQEDRLAASSSPITATTRPATTSATSTGTSTSASTGCSSASTKRKRTSPSTSSSTRRSSMGFGDGEKLRYAKRVGRRSRTSASRTSIASRIVVDDRQVIERMPPTRGKARIFKVFRFLRGARARGQDRSRRRAEDVRRAEQAPRPRVLAQRSLRSARLRARHQRAPLQQVRSVRRPRRRPRARRSRSSRGDVLLYDCETGDEREVTVTAKVLERFERGYEEYLDEIERFCTSKQVPYFRADVNVPFDELDPARLPPRRVPPLIDAPRRRSLSPTLARDLRAAAALAIVVALHPEAAAPHGRGAVLEALGAHPPRQGGDEPLLAAEAPALAARAARAPRAARRSRSAIRARRRRSSRGATSSCSSTRARRCRRPTSRPKPARARRRSEVKKVDSRPRRRGPHARSRRWTRRSRRSDR